MRKSNRTWTAALAALAFGLPAAIPAPADAAVVICQKGNRIKLRVDACKGKETAVDPSELGVEVPDGGVTATKLAADAMPAIGSITLFNQDVVSTTNTTPTSLDRFTVDVPAAGVLHVTVAGQFWLDADASSADSLTTNMFLGLCDSIDSNLDCGGTYDYFYYQDADNADSSNSTHGFTITRTVPVAGPGQRTFFVNGAVTGVADELHLWGCDFDGLVCNGGPVATVTFVPGSLNITRPIL
jgi:hypothetical protein